MSERFGRQALLIPLALLASACATGEPLPDLIPPTEPEGTEVFAPTSRCIEPDDDDLAAVDHFGDAGGPWRIVAAQRVDVRPNVQHVVSYVRELVEEDKALNRPGARETHVLDCKPAEAETSEYGPGGCVFAGRPHPNSLARVEVTAQNVAKACVEAIAAEIPIGDQ